MSSVNKIKFTDDTDAIVRKMAQLGMAYTRENYLALNFLGDVPDEIDPELEFSMPEDLQLNPPEHFD